MPMNPSCFFDAACSSYAEGQLANTAVRLRKRNRRKVQLQETKEFGIEIKYKKNTGLSLPSLSPPATPDFMQTVLQPRASTLIEGAHWPMGYLSLGPDGMETSNAHASFVGMRHRTREPGNRVPLPQSQPKVLEVVRRPRCGNDTVTRARKQGSCVTGTPRGSTTMSSASRALAQAAG